MSRTGYIVEGKDLITQVASFISSTTMTSMRWAECISTSMLSTVMGPDRFISNLKGKLNLNVWYLCVGPSGLASKTIAMKTYLFPIIGAVGENEHLILPNRFSVEGYIKYIAGNSTGSIIRDEFTGLLKESGKEYLSDVLEFLSELYDGTIQKRVTIKHSVNEIKRCYVTFITATTPYLYKIMRPEFYTQGTGNRIMVEIFDIDNVRDDVIDHESFFRGAKFEDRREGFINEVVTILQNIRDSPVRHFLPDKDAGRIWTEFEAECRQNAKRHYKKNIYDLHYSYLARSAEMALKLSAIFSMSRMWHIVTMSDCPMIQIVTGEDMQRAVDKSRHHYQQFCRMLEQWRARPEVYVAKTLDEQANYVMDILRESQWGVSWTQLRKSSRWDTYTWREVLKFLYETNRIKVAKLDSNSQGGRRPITFFDKERVDGTEIQGQVFEHWKTIQLVLNM